jgi:hypothetical protein
MEATMYKNLESKLPKGIEWDLNFGFDCENLDELSLYGFDFQNFNIDSYKAKMLKDSEFYHLEVLDSNVNVSKRVTYTSLSIQTFENVTDTFICAFYLNDEDDICFMEYYSID